MTAQAEHLSTRLSLQPVASAKTVGVLRLHRVGRTVLRLVGVFVPVFLLGTFATFLLGNLSGLSPAYLQLGESATPEQVAALEREWGLDRPFVVQYLDWFGSLLRGDLGNSWYNGQSISELLLGRAIVSLSASFLALVIGVVVGFALGVLAAAFRGRPVDRGVTAFTTLISTMPPFVVGIALVAVFAVSLGWLPSAGYLPLDAGLWPWLSHLLLPAIALSFDTIADVARQLRTGLVTASGENYVTGAIVRGLSPRRVFFVHVLRNGVSPAIAILGMKFPNLLGGAVVTEAIFGLAGYGVFASESALRGDVPAVQGVLVIAVVLVVTFNVIVNLILNRISPASARGV
ncbi:ABC transporter permease [Microbacterium betulae]|uniref:ABC transporter permease n=1 Tax=Microbacterium betulae TaxID=2981139 RepID=A0AA97FIX2_9MICO|nr:ABC transporter permease [Microbacterium sp. AB]WOF23494.1 ABC transporter permease [Microbacterium sp. AB]